MPELTPDDVRAIVHEELNAHTERLTETMRDIETRLLSAFHSYATVSDIRFRKLESNEGNNNKAVELRLAQLEEQMRELQGRVQKGGM